MHPPPDLTEFRPGEIIPLSAIDKMIPGKLVPDDLDPLADGILMDHQKGWLEDQSPVKICEKGRRTGITFVESLDSVFIAAASRGDDYFYIPDAKEKGLEFIGNAAKFARHVAQVTAEIEQFLFEDQQDDEGNSRFINSYRIRFASGFKIVALSSRPAAIRGLQGVVGIDEAAFHRDVGEVMDAVGALLIWGGRIRLISSHNGVKNPFNVAIQDTLAGKTGYSHHHIPFDDAVAAGLYERVCLKNGWTPSVKGKEDWYRRVRGVYGTRKAAMHQELDAIPKEGSGVAIPLNWIEACSTDEFQVVRWSPSSEDFVDWPEYQRRLEFRTWLETVVRPLIEALMQSAREIFGGLDFGMLHDRSCLPFFRVAQNLTREVPVLVELHKVPYDQQRQVFSWLKDDVGFNFSHLICDANGNGMALAQECRQMFGHGRVTELNPRAEWYRQHGPKFRSAFEGRTILIPADVNVRDDVRELQEIDGVIRVPANVRTPPSKTDDSIEEARHADAAMALYYGYVATLQPVEHFDYEAVKADRRRERPVKVTRGFKRIGLW